MKKNHILLASLLVSFTLNAQIIDIPDANFKNALVNTNCVDTDGNFVADSDADTNDDGEISVSEAEAVTFLNVTNNSISSLEGIENFINLEILNCNVNELTELNISALTNLTSLGCVYNQLTSLNLDSQSNLVGLDCSYNQITQLNTSASNNLEQLTCNNNQLTTLNVSNNINIYVLVCHDNLLANLDTSDLQSLLYLECQNNVLTELIFPNSNLLDEINVSNNQLTFLDFSSQSNIQYIFAQNNNFISLNFKNGVDQSFSVFYYEPGDPGGTAYPFDNNPNLSYICVDESEINAASSWGNYISQVDCEANPYCSFSPGGNYFTIEGNAILDSNANGCGPDDNGLPNLFFTVTDSNDEIAGAFTSNTLGEYSYPNGQGLYTIAPTFENSNYYTVSPENITVDFPSDASPFVQDFCISPNGDFNDLEITFFPIDEARPGFDAYYKIVYKNKGTTILSGSIDLTFQDDLMDLVSANPTEDSQSVNMLSWNFADLTPFESREIYLTMNINSPMETPPVNGDDVLVFDASVNSSETDETTDDNTINLNQTVVNSFDPNDKNCLEGDVISPEQVGEFVHYRIRFENTGTANAINVVVKDNIDRTKYDLSSLVPLDASHDFVARIKDDASDYYVEFIFENINLPFDDANNDGYVVFKIRTLDTLVLNDTFENEAEIYFDFNFPIITNTAQTTVATLSTENYEFNNTSILLYPNPNNGILHLESQQAIKHISIYDLSGRQIQDIAVIGIKTNIDISTEALSAGTYFIKIKSTKGALTKKFIKE